MKRLVTHVGVVLAANPTWAELPVADGLLLASESLLRSVLAERSRVARDGALDLLAADACVTWAFEAAADEPSSLGARAAGAMRRFAEEAR